MAVVLRLAPAVVAVAARVRPQVRPGVVLQLGRAAEARFEVLNVWVSRCRALSVERRMPTVEHRASNAEVSTLELSTC
ncbi:MAG: hypothetical protein ACKO5F_14280 [Synechococcus sp.]